ncbi:MAG: 30S ribosomal protein S20 [Bacteroidota bacterium]
MPQHKSAEKRVRQNAKRRTRNRYQKVRVRTLIKDLEATQDPTAAAEKLRVVKAQLDRLATKGIFHRNKVAHVKSRLERHVNGLT